jgi:hypothetical protein
MNAKKRIQVMLNNSSITHITATPFDGALEDAEQPRVTELNIIDDCSIRL